MEKKLVWKGFETFEEMEAEIEASFQRLTPYQRIARLFALFAMSRALGLPAKAIDPDAFILKKRNDTTS